MYLFECIYVEAQNKITKHNKNELWKTWGNTFSNSSARNNSMSPCNALNDAYQC